MQALGPALIEEEKKFRGCRRCNRFDPCDGIGDNVDQLVLQGSKDCAESEVEGGDEEEEVSPQLQQGTRVAWTLP